MDEEATRPSHQLNMLEGGIFGKMCKVAIPIALMSTLQQLFNAIDMAVAGRLKQRHGCGGFQCASDQYRGDVVYRAFNRLKRIDCRFGRSRQERTSQRGDAYWFFGGIDQWADYADGRLPDC